MALARRPAGSVTERALPPHQKLRLAAEIFLTYGRVRWLVARHGLPRAVAVLRRQGSSHALTVPPLADGLSAGARLGRAVGRTLAPLPANTLCLMESLVLLRLLVRRGVQAELIIAVRPGADELSAHAWIELEEQPLLPPAEEDYGRLLSL